MTSIKCGGCAKWLNVCPCPVPGVIILPLSQLEGQVLNLSLIVANKMQPIYWPTLKVPFVI